MQNFRQWLVENSLAPNFQLSELKRQFGIDNEVIDGVVCFIGGVGPVAKEIDGKHFCLNDWTELYVGEDVTVDDDEKFSEEDEILNTPIISPNKGKK